MLGVEMLHIIAEIARLIKAVHQIMRSFLQILLLYDVLFADLVIKLALEVVFSR
jgi:hypothetical protein